MKYLTLALACSFVLAACGGSDDTPVTPPAGLEGLWQANSVYLVSDRSSALPLPSGEMYMNLENASENPIDTNLYTLSETANCLDLTSDQITHVGNNRYLDGFGEIATITVNGSSLSLHLSADNQTMGIDFQKNTAMAKADLPVCSLQNDATSNVEDAAPGTFLKSIFTKVMQKL